MKTDRLPRPHLKGFLLGLISALGFFLMMGMTGVDDVSPPLPNYGRYQISSWAGNFGNHSGGVGAFVVDTVSGEVRTAYLRLYGDAETETILKNNLKKPFTSMR